MLFKRNRLEMNLPEGAVLRTDLWGGIFKHTGIYIGENKVIEAIPDKKNNALIHIVSLDKFLNGTYGFRHRTGIFCYIA